MVWDFCVGFVVWCLFFGFGLVGGFFERVNVLSTKIVLATNVLLLI